MAYFDRFPLMTYDVKNNNQYKLLPDMYYTCTGKDGVFYEGQCWQSVIAQGEVDLPKMSVENCKKILKGT